MIKLYIDVNESYPVYTLLEKPYYTGDLVIELTEEEFLDYHKANQVYHAWQKRISEVNGDAY